MAKKYGRTQKQDHFATAVHVDIPRSTFFRNSSLKTVFDAGTLVPIYLDEVLPGDTFEMSIDFVSRLLTPVVPVMDRLIYDVYAFFVPNRIVWSQWERLIANTNTQGAWIPTTPAPNIPTFSGNSGQEMVDVTSLGDYYGLPFGCIPDQVGGINSLPFRGYAMIWNEWFRDQNLQAPLMVNPNSNVEVAYPDYHYTYGPMQVNKKHDYFTSCLPSPQKGESQLIPIAFNDVFPVFAMDDQPWVKSLVPMRMANVDSAQGLVPQTGWHTMGVNSIAQGQERPFVRAVQGTVPSSTPSVNVAPSNLYADPRYTQATSTTISELRTAFQVQRLYERDARGGTRYREMLKAHFGVDVEDYRTQVPEYLGHITREANFFQVAQTSSTTNTPQGNLSAFSYNVENGLLFKKTFVEHGFVHIFIVARVPRTYQNGIDKLWTRKERLDYYLPVLSHISEQPVYSREIYGLDVNPEEIFGYNEAWAEYRFKPNRVTGRMRDGVDNSFSVWHFADYYDSKPTLSSQWIADDSSARIMNSLAVDGNYGQILLDCAFKNTCTREMPVHSIPGLVDHF